ncbi:MAG TPA: hypothetical protein VHX36_13445 [Candidatus Acidoferrales bacterium]|jgi:hypothetical protein|nr:hypothetical protein [Candidatus Acidoferrales bacterium]
MAPRTDDQITIKRYRLGNMQSFEVLVGDFNRIEDEAQSIGTHLGFALACIPVAITINITLATVAIPNQNVKAPFMLLMFACYILGAFFSVSAFRQRGRLRKFMQTIRDNQEPPLGEKGNEMSPSDVESLTPDEEEPELGSDHPESAQ